MNKYNLRLLNCGKLLPHLFYRYYCCKIPSVIMFCYIAVFQIRLRPRPRPRPRSQMQPHRPRPLPRRGAVHPHHPHQGLQVNKILICTLSNNKNKYNDWSIKYFLIFVASKNYDFFMLWFRSKCFSFHFYYKRLPIIFVYFIILVKMPCKNFSLIQ